MIRRRRSLGASPISIAPTGIAPTGITPTAIAPTDSAPPVFPPPVLTRFRFRPLLRGSFPPPLVFPLLCVSCECSFPKVVSSTFGRTNSNCAAHCSAPLALSPPWIRTFMVAAIPRREGMTPATALNPNNPSPQRAFAFPFPFGAALPPALVLVPTTSP